MEFLELKYRRLAADAETENDRWASLDGTFRTAADTWLVIHDLFHHMPDDKGSLAEELATLGAEYYVNFEGSSKLSLTDAKAADLPPPGMNALTRNAAGIVGVAFEDGTDGAEGFDLSMQDGAPVDDIAEYVFAAAERTAVQELEYLLWGASGDLEWTAAKNAFCTPGVVASWIRKGYRAAQQRYPDQARARASWNEAEEYLFALSRQVSTDAVLVAKRQGYSATFEVVA